MPFFQNQTAKYGRSKSILSGTNAHLMVEDFTVPAGAAVNDVVELGAVPHAARIIDVHVFQDGVGAGCTCDVGLISGDYGDSRTGGRTCGNELYTSLSIAAAGKAAQTTRNLAAVAPVDKAVGFGIKFTGAVPTAGKKITVALLLASA
jgi:hypothetical protein